MPRKAKDERVPAALGEPQGRDLSLPPLNWLRGFEATARIGSFTGAAQALGLTQAAVSYQVRSLEQHLGFPLFERLPHGVKLTDMGKAYLPSVQKAFDEIATSTMGLFGASTEASLAVRTPISFGALWLAPRLKSFCTAYPGIAIRLYSAIFNFAIPAERVDIEVRVGNGEWPGFSAERIENDPVITVGQPLGRRKAGRLTLADLAGETLIEIMEVDDAWARTFKAAGLPPPRRRQIIRVDSSVMALELASAGLGYALILRSFAQPYIERGRLADVLGVSRPPRMSHYLLRPLEQQRRKPEAGLFADWLRQEARRSGLLPAA
ncbi:MAG TPA: LysR substrate-binding domain-containing protein [Kiloniellales bacterium]|nr:LysR substrate-binding domain-containing protein [Kiloniellales bacterium]